MIPWRDLPAPLAALRELALDLRWTWSHEADELWARVDDVLWRGTRNPWTVLDDVSTQRLAELAADAGFVAHLDRLVVARRAYLTDRSWFAEERLGARLGGVAWFSMEFGLGEALPLYAGGLGVLAGDFLKAASDLGLPVIGIGLLYQEGYFRQMIDAEGRQFEAFPYNDPSSMPIEPVREAGGGWLRIPVELPGRVLQLRVWRVIVGRTRLYLLDSNDPVNGPVDRGIAGKLYGGGGEMRMMQEIVLGIGGWRLVEALHPEIEVCHLNEGHAAFAVLERARAFAKRHGLSFSEALWATRAGNVFTTHTPVAAGFDRYPLDALTRYVQAWAAGEPTFAELQQLGVTEGPISDGALNMAYLAARRAFLSFGVSRLHGAVSRRIFQPLYPRWPEHEVPFGHITNGVHAPTWDSAEADAIWTRACGKERWRHEPEDMGERCEMIEDQELWALRGAAREALVRSVRTRLGVHLSGRGHPPEVVAVSETVLDPNVLTLGFARRFTAYKRPDLLLSDPARLARLLCDETRPAQLVLAGKAHPDDEAGKRMIQEWIRFAQDPRYRRRVVFLEDYDISLAQELVRGVDVWINTPRRPWEACGTSGMKVLVNGGLNLSTLDGWWEEAYRPDLGWAIGDGKVAESADQDSRDAEELYAVLEREAAPTFYDRDASGIPRAWVARMRRSMTDLTAKYGASRMVREYLDKAYLPAARALHERVADGGAGAKAMAAWSGRLKNAWPNIHIGQPDYVRQADGWEVSVPVYLGEIAPADVRMEIYGEPLSGFAPEVIALSHDGAITGAVGAYFWRGRFPGARPADDYPARVVPSHAGVRTPAEIALIHWQR
ncbi:alpha-glucan family phosphorylase [Rhodoblastus sp.]|uniref:alpha-glucan family phosphorylase n=1 Tax=Rhodoblastus sp. TaxID=1962975 RepID=UPI003F96D88C